MIRTLTQEDIPQLADVHAGAWGTGSHTLEELRSSYQCYFPSVYFDNPWYDPDSSSLVYEDPDGHIAGQLAVVTRPMSLNGMLIQMAVSSQMCVEPGSRSQLAGIQLLKQFLAGPQDLSIANMANASARKVWEALGGITSPLHSLTWLRVLRPCQFAGALIRERRSLRWIDWSTRPFGRVLDRLMSLIPRGPFRAPDKTLNSIPLTPQFFLDRLPEFTNGYSLRPRYDADSVAWVWERLDRAWESGTVRKQIVRNERGQAQGWFIYQLNPGGIGEVAQVVATRETIADVLSELFRDAAQGGAVALTGQMQPDFMQAMSDQYCVFHQRQYSALVHARDAEILRAFEQGTAFLTMLEGEGCLNHVIDPTPAVPNRPASRSDSPTASIATAT